MAKKRICIAEGCGKCHYARDLCRWHHSQLRSTDRQGEAKVKPLPSQEELRRYLDYNPDTGDFTWLQTASKGGWAKAGRIAGGPASRYTSIQINGIPYYAHRLAFVWMTGSCLSPHVDHINGNGRDNRWVNLRPATVSQNGANKITNASKSSGLKGAQYDPPTGRWKSRITVEQKEIWLGRFNTPQEAHEAYVKAAKKYFGEFAVEGTPR